MKKKTHNAGTMSHDHAAAAGRLAAAAGLYGALVWYFFHGQNDEPGQWLTALNWFVGALGCFVLSRRWIGAFGGSLFAGAVYGFSPFALGLAAYHPLAGVPVAILGWLFCPAAYWRRWAPSMGRHLARAGRGGPAAMTVALCLLPFAGVIVFFWLCGRPEIGPVFPLPVGLKLEVPGLAGLIIPLAMRPHDIVFSFYHVPLAALVMGLCMYFLSGRLGVMLIVGPAVVLAFANPVAQVSPVVWASVPMLVGAIVVGLGMEGLAWAGAADGRWLLFCAAATGIVTAGCVYLSMADGAMYRCTALLHAGGLLSVGVIYAMTRAGLRLHPVRWILLSAAMGIDLLSSGKQLADVVL